MTARYVEKSGINDSSVAVFCDPFLIYPEEGPFNPNCDYPEYPFSGRGGIDSSNHVYGAVRQTLRLLGMDAARYGTREWNPFGGLIHPGNTVLLKPNAVVDKNFDPSESIFACITHASVLRCLVDYAYLALKGNGRIIIADAPIAEVDFDCWKKQVQVESIVAFYKTHAAFTIEVMDLRKSDVRWDTKYGYNPSTSRRQLKGDPNGYVTVDLGNDSALSGFDDRDISRLYGSDYDTAQTRSHHRGGRHEYLVAGSVLNADVVIAVPKLKTHKMVGVTLSMKGMVGAQGDKNYIPHCRIGSPRDGGDEYPNVGPAQRLLARYRMWLLSSVLARGDRLGDRLFLMLNVGLQGGRKALEWFNRLRYKETSGPIYGGSWYGNDTTWRIALDLTKIILYADRNGKIKDSPQRRLFCLVDGVLGGEGEGPLAARAKPCGVLVGGLSPLAVDAVGARLMGCDPLRIPMIAEGLKDSSLMTWGNGLAGIRLVANQGEAEGLMVDRKRPMFSFDVSQGWRGHIEIARSAQ